MKRLSMAAAIAVVLLAGCATTASPSATTATTPTTSTTTSIPKGYVQLHHRSTFLATFTGQYKAPDTGAWTSGPVAVAAGTGSTCSIVGTPTASVLPTYPTGAMSVSVLVNWVELTGDGPQGHLGCVHSRSIEVTATRGAKAQANWLEDSPE